LDAKTEVYRETLNCLMDGIFQAMANQMALAKAMHTGRRVSPDEFYKRTSRNVAKEVELINQHGFATMKALFTST
ncbi:MAG: hypothetical protein SGI77_12665, partial [Pirellulaceae bacterium]|nr:hypothetical protein [Pirellulaceae bacterium]